VQVLDTVAPGEFDCGSIYIVQNETYSRRPDPPDGDHHDSEFVLDPQSGEDVTVKKVHGPLQPSVVRPAQTVMRPDARAFKGPITVALVTPSGTMP
jgi:hypothetical protein